MKSRMNGFLNTQLESNMADNLKNVRRESRKRSNSAGSRIQRTRSKSPTGRGQQTTISRSRENSTRSSLETMDREGVLATLGYNVSKPWKPSVPLLDKSELCLRCGKKVYPVERIDVGGFYHKGCFKCKVCGIQLTLKTFQREIDLNQPKVTKEVFCRQHVPRGASGQVDADALEIRRAVNAQKHASAQMRGTGYDHEAHYDPDALEFQHVKDVKRRKKLRRRSTLRSSKDFEKFGVYDAQKALEEVHRQEEDELYRQMFEDRRRHVDKLERHLKEERNRTVREIIEWFERRGASREEKEAGIKKIENFYLSQREDRMQLLLQRLTMEEQSAVARLIEKHSQEMLVLIQEKEKEAENAMKFEFRESQLLEGGGEVLPPQQDEEEDTDTEEDPEEADEDTQEISESFSEASYRLEQCERSSNVRRVVHPGQKSARSSQFGSEGSLNLQNHSAMDPDDQYSQGFEGHGSQRASWRSGAHQHSESTDLQHQQNNNIHGSLPFEYFPYELDDEGEVLVRVHAAKDAHLISDHLKSSHFCQSPEAERTAPFFYDFGIRAKSPKPYRRRLADPSKDASQKPQKAAGKGDGKFMLFQKPGQKAPQYPENDETANKTDKQKNSTSKKKGKRRKSQNSLTESKRDLDVNTRLKSHADKAREALRAMSLGISPAVEEGSTDDVFLDVQPTAPKIAPPPTKKDNLYRSPEVFKELDDNAVNETKREHRTFTELVRKLSKGCQNELQRIRAIFRWITAKDLNEMQFDETLDPDSPVGLLRGIKFGVESYHNLLKRLCSYAGLHCEIIDGYSKGAGYKPGGRFKGAAFRNQWTAVCIDGAWRFVNCNWGARHVKGPRDDHMTYKCDEFYFMTDPEDHIYQHFPNDQSWQLLKNPITLDEFVKLPVLKSPFFNRQLAFSLDYDSTVHTSDGCAEIRIVSPSQDNFTAQLKSKDGLIKPEVLQDRVIVRRVNDEVIFVTNLPSTGNYYLEIYVGQNSEAGSMNNACSFRLCCYSVSSNAHISYPPIACFGRTPHFRKTKMKEETHTDPYITHNGELLVAFFSPPNVKLSHTLRYWNHRDRHMEDVDRFAFMIHRSEHLTSYTIHCPRRGGYVFALLATNDPEAPSSSMKCIYRYYIDCKTASENAHPFPKATKRWRNCRLIEPTTGDLNCRTKTRFRVESSTATELVVHVNDNWFHLQRSGNLWQGVVNTGDDKGKLFVYGRFEATKEKYIPLLEYNVKGPRSLEDDVKSMLRYI